MSRSTTDRLALGLALGLLVGCSGSDRPGPTPAPAPPPVAPFAPLGAPVAPAARAPSGPGAVQGTVAYEDRAYDATGLAALPTPRPARGVLVRAVDVAGGELASTRTDEAGAFSLTLPSPPGTLVRVEAVADMVHGAHGIRVLTDTPSGAGYAVSSAPFALGASPAPVALVAPATAEAGAFNVLDVAYEAFRVFGDALPDTLPPLAVAWERGRARPCTSCYVDETETIQLGAHPDDPDEFDDDIILHELAHYFAEHTHADDNPGGAHRDRRVDPTLAYPEGLAYFVSCVVRGAPTVIDTYGRGTRVWDFERVTLDGAPLPEARGTSTGTAHGLLREEVAGAILWDVVDPARPDEPFDRLAVDRRVVLSTLFGGVHDDPTRGPKGIDLTDALDALACRARVPVADLLALTAERGYPWTPPVCR